MRLSNPLFLASVAVLVVSASCTLITDVDRSKIPDGTGEGGSSGSGGSTSQPTEGGVGATAIGGGAGEGTVLPIAGAPSEGGTGTVEPIGGAGAGGAPLGPGGSDAGGAGAGFGGAGAGGDAP